VSRLTLQDYAAEARELISQRAYDEAIAVCRHILKRYPTHLKTYQVLGEACLEKGDLAEAENVFKRLLGQADPENFVAYAGLGFIREEQGQYDEAIWYMERAFELAPNREEVRHALRRLYEKRDGVEPTRIKLNKAALARLYSRGGQYRQAIEEFQTLLAAEGNQDRMDLKLSLAEMLWRDGHREQAAEMLEQVLRVCPSCLKALLILGSIQLEKGQREEGQAILAETRRLDPEHTVAQVLFGEQSPLSPASVRISRLQVEVAASPESFAAEDAAEGSESEAATNQEMTQPHPSPELEPEQVAPDLPEEDTILDLTTAPDAQADSAASPEDLAPPGEAAVPQVAPSPVESPASPVTGAVEVSDRLEQEVTGSDEALGGEAESLEAHPLREPESGEGADDGLAFPEPEPSQVDEEEDLPDEELADQSTAAPEVLLAAPGAGSAGSEIERHRTHLQSSPRDYQTRLMLARAYRDQEQMKLALEQYSKLSRAKRDIVSEVVRDVEMIVASRPDNLEAHELLADYYAKGGQLQEAVDRYRWILRRLETQAE